jgi:hypothetical protein
MKNIKIDENKLEEYINSAKDYCLVNGLVIFPKDIPQNNNNHYHYNTICLPVTLIPTKFSKYDFNYALNLQNKINLLVHNVSINKTFLNESLSE